MPNVIEIPFHPTNRIWETYKHFPYRAWYAVGELVDNSTQSFFDHRPQLEEAMRARGEGFHVSIDFDPRNRVLTIADNAMGMDLDELRRAVQLAAPPPDTSGRCEFGMGLKTAASWLGDSWAVRTKKFGSDKEYSFEINIAAHANSSAETLAVVEKTVAEREAHYTMVTIKQVRKDFQRRALGKVRQHLAEMYRNDIRDGAVTLLWNGESLIPPTVEVLQTTFEAPDADGQLVTQTRTWRMPVEFEVTLDADSGEKRPVRGWMSIVNPGGRNKAGFDLFRRGRIIVGRPSGYRPERIFGLDRNDLINQRLYGELHLDDLPVNHLKDDFLWGEWGEEFDEKLEQIGADYRRQAQDYRPTRVGRTAVPAAVVQATNDEIAESLSTEEMAERIHLLESVGPTPPPPAEERQAEAEVLRDQPLEPLVISHHGKVYRIYHPVGMAPEQSYVRYEAPGAQTVDIFINDNHPHVSDFPDGPEGAERYQAHAHTCVVDAIVVHLLTGLGREIAPDLFLQYKDQLLRAMRS